MAKTIVIDVDGVLTDDKFWVDQHGNTSKGFNTKDVRAIRELISLGYEVYLITASSWPGIHSFASKTGAHVFVSRNKVAYANLFKDFIIIGNDAWDVQLSTMALHVYQPEDGNLGNATRIPCKGGNGVIAVFLKCFIHGPVDARDITLRMSEFYPNGPVIWNEKPKFKFEPPFPSQT